MLCGALFVLAGPTIVPASLYTSENGCINNAEKSEANSPMDHVIVLQFPFIHGAWKALLRGPCLSTSI